ncbi:DUF2905 domain-containing protein [Chlorobium ferrooxidans]|uniref:DUF2905 domain-containing protein n=1 Tax=Chlorobium ferrooxidans DSM 13031 TaxID=377431 RepID=Q0YPA3_9CHLB|nr:DUF2905 domain-containing protein [Chlorobium ferrooxidans]EAT58125.1 conserved hypothetical protein [Chlorobium ferrooxidans DSM 13031]
MFSDAGKLLVIAGAVTIVVGLFMMASGKTGLSGWFNWFGSLPFDMKIEKENFRLYFPLGSSILISIVLSILFYFLNKFIR